MDLPMVINLMYISLFQIQVLPVPVTLYLPYQQDIPMPVNHQIPTRTQILQVESLLISLYQTITDTLMFFLLILSMILPTSTPIIPVDPMK